MLGAALLAITIVPILMGYLIRGKINGLEASEIQEHLHDLPASISLPHTELLRTESISELLRTLEQGPYRNVAVQARRSYEENQEPFLLDATIDQRYYTSLLRQIRRAQPDDRPSLFRLIGGLVDQQNLNWLIRYRFNYELSASETYYLLIPFGLQLHRDQLLALVNLDSIEQVIESLPPPLAAALAEGATRPLCCLCPATVVGRPRTANISGSTSTRKITPVAAASRYSVAAMPQKSR